MMPNSFITPSVQIAAKHNRKSVIAPPRHIILIPNQRYLLLLLRFTDSDCPFVSSNSSVLVHLDAACLADKQHIPIL